MQLTWNRFAIVLSFVSAFALCFPTTVPARESSDDESAGCHPGIAAGLGALAGGLLGKKDRARGAALGAGIAALACVALNYQSRQTKSADDVRREFKESHAGRLPETSAIAAYRSRFEPSNRIRPGSSATLTSYIEVVQGTAGGNPAIEQEIVIYGPDGKELKRTRKPANPTGGAGAFESKFSLTMPDGVPQGTYVFKTALFLDGAPAQTADVPLEIVQLGHYPSVAATDL